MEAALKRYRLEILLFVMALVTASYFSHAVDLDNVSSRFFMLSSIVDFGRLSIDGYKDRTVDVSFFGGRYYSNKSIGTAVVGVPVYWALRQIPPFRDQPPLTVAQRYVIRVVTTTLPFAILAITMFRLAKRLGAPPRTALLMVFAYSFGTLALVHASMFSGHQIAASFGFFAFAILAYLRNRTPPHHETGLALGAGLFAGLAALTDYTAMFTALVLTIYVFSARIRLRSKLAFLSGGVFCAALLAGYNWKCFGSAFSVSYSYQISEGARKGFEQGLLGFRLPTAHALFGLLGSPSRGLLFIMPVFIFSLYGVFYWWNHQRGRAELYVILAIVLGYLTLVSGFHFWHGSRTYGPRLLVPMLPFLAFPMIFAKVNTRWFWLTFAASILLVAPAMIGLAETRESIMNPIVEVVIPCISRGCLSDNWGSWLGLKFPWSILPIVALSVTLGWYATHRLTTATQQSTMLWMEKVGVGTWLAVIAVMLLTVRTFPPEFVARERANIHLDLGNALTARGSTERAIAHYQEAVRINPDYAEAHNNLGLVLVRAGKIQEAIEHYEQALRIDPDLAETHNNLGNALSEAGRIEEAIRHYEQALRINPRYVEAHSNLGNVLLHAGRIQEAIAHCEQALTINPDYAEAHNNLGNALSEAGDIEGAIWHCERAVRIDPGIAAVHYNLGNVLFRAGKVEDATRQYAEALRINPRYAEAHNNWGTVLFRTGKVQEALGHYEQALSINPDYAEAHNNLAIALAQAGRIPEAIGHWEQALRINPDYSEAQSNLARVRSPQ